MNEIDKLLLTATAETDNAANEFERSGECTFGQVDPGLINFQRFIGRAQVALMRSQIDCLRAQALLMKRSVSPARPEVDNSHRGDGAEAVAP